MATTSWHAARTGHQPTPTPMQKKAIEKLYTTNGTPSSPSPLDPSSSLTSRAPSSVGVHVGVVPSLPTNDPPEDWSHIPYSLTSVLQSLVARESESSRHLQCLKHACEELKRCSKEYVTHSGVNTFTVGTAALQRDLSSFKTRVQHQHTASTTRVQELEMQVTQQAEQITQLTRRLTQLEASTTTNMETIRDSLSHTQGDIQQRGMIMAKLSDRLMDEVDAQRNSLNLVEGKLKEVERRVYIWEYSTSAGAAAAAHAGTSLVPASLSNPHSISNSIQARKTSPNFLTHDSVQLNPPGTAVFMAAAKAAMGLAEPPVNNHPLADIIDQHKFEKEQEAEHATQKEVIKQQMELQQQQQQAQSQSTPPPPAGLIDSDLAVASPGGWSDSDPTPAPLLQLTAPTPGRHSSHPSSGSSSMQLQSVPHAATPFPPSTPRTAATAAAAIVANPNPAHPGLLPTPPPGSSDTAIYQRYMQDYTTRNLQRDLLEIAETYQSTIRNEVDGLRGQLLAARRGHSEDMAKQNASFDSFTKNQTSSMIEMKRTISGLEVFLKTKVSELLQRMSSVEKTASLTDSLSLARGAQIEMKYQQRNEEIVSALTNMQGRLDETFVGKLTTQRTNVERELQMVRLNQEQTQLQHSSRLTNLNQDFIHLKSELHEIHTNLTKQITSVHTQMKSLFADAFASLSPSILPQLTTSCATTSTYPTTSSSSSSSNNNNPVSEKVRVQVRPRTMEVGRRKSTARMGQNNVTMFETTSRFKTINGGGGEGESDQALPSQHDSITYLSSPSLYDEEKSLPLTPRGYGTSQQVRLRPPAISNLSRGHGTTNASSHIATPAGEGGSMMMREPRMEDILKIGRRELNGRPATSHGTTVHANNSAATPNGGSTNGGGGENHTPRNSPPTHHQNPTPPTRPRTMPGPKSTP